jgi:hypothetical protein
VLELGIAAAPHGGRFDFGDSVSNWAWTLGTLIWFGRTLSRNVTESSLCVIDEIAAHLARRIMAATRLRRGSGNAGA